MFLVLLNFSECMFRLCMTNFCNTTNFMLCVVLESIDLMLLILSRQAYKAIGGLGNYLGIANWMDTRNR